MSTAVKKSGIVKSAGAHILDTERNIMADDVLIFHCDSRKIDGFPAFGFLKGGTDEGAETSPDSGAKADAEYPDNHNSSRLCVALRH